MGNESKDGLLSLTICPLMTCPARGTRKNEKPLRIPPFPGVDLRWDAFTIPALRLISIHTNIVGDWLCDLAEWHEAGHVCLGRTPYLRLLQYEMYKLYLVILKTFTNTKEQIEVPLKADISGNTLQSKLAFIEAMKKGSVLIEEVYCVHTSLLHAVEKGLIEPDDLLSLERRYKRGYGKYIPGPFALAYDAFDLVVKKIGGDPADGMLNSVLKTLNPKGAFYDILSILCRFNPNTSNKLKWQLPAKVTGRVAEFSNKEAEELFTALLSNQDPDDSLYRRRTMIDYATETVQNMRKLEQLLDDENDFFKSLLRSPEILFLTAHNKSLCPIFLRINTSKLSDKDCKYVGMWDPIILLESILEQLIYGNGLMCPWFTPGQCCGHATIREFLESVWEGTTRGQTCKRWERLGCLGW